MTRYFLLFIVFVGFNSYGQFGLNDPCIDSLYIPRSFCVSCGTANYSIDLPCTPEKFKFSIFDSKKNLVFRSEDAGFKWDGKTELGISAKSGTYVWHIDIVIGMRVYSDKGFLNIL